MMKYFVFFAILLTVAGHEIGVQKQFSLSRSPQSEIANSFDQSFDESSINFVEGYRPETLDALGAAWSNDAADTNTVDANTADTNALVETMISNANNERPDDQSKSQIRQVCDLPRELINPDYYADYCFSGSCALVNERCEDHKDCCSQMCSNGRCLPNANHKVHIGDRCNNNQECATGICEKHPNGRFKICYGTNRPGLCSFNGEACFENSNCCSNSCYNKRCIGSPEYPSRRNEFCLSSHNECASLQCDFSKKRCR